MRRVIELCIEKNVGEITLIKTLNQIPELQYGKIPTEKDPGMVLMTINNIKAVQNSFSNFSWFLTNYRLQRQLKFNIRKLLKPFRKQNPCDI